MVKHIQVNRTSTREIEEELESTINFINQNRLTGEISKSKIMRIALIEWIEKQKRIKKILEENEDIDKSAQEILMENKLI